MTTNPFATPAAAGSGIKWADHLGDLLVIEPHSVRQVDTALGPRDAIAADIHAIIDGPAGGCVDYEDVLVFPRILQAQLHGRLGQKVLGRLGQGTARPGQSAPWVLQDPTPEDTAAATAWLEARSKNQFAAPAQSQAGQAYDRPPF